jgi:hypothetical protein
MTRALTQQLVWFLVEKRLKIVYIRGLVPVFIKQILMRIFIAAEV